jgi:hypothetical protein
LTGDAKGKGKEHKEMTVKELMAELKKLPEDYPIRVNLDPYCTYMADVLEVVHTDEPDDECFLYCQPDFENDLVWACPDREMLDVWSESPSLPPRLAHSLPKTPCLVRDRTPSQNVLSRDDLPRDEPNPRGNLRGH